jgi:hypothetical protein
MAFINAAACTSFARQSSAPAFNILFTLSASLNMVRPITVIPGAAVFIFRVALTPFNKVLYCFPFSRIPWGCRQPESVGAGLQGMLDSLNLAGHPERPGTLLPGSYRARMNRQWQLPAP